MSSDLVPAGPVGGLVPAIAGAETPLHLIADDVMGSAYQQFATNTRGLTDEERRGVLLSLFGPDTVTDEDMSSDGIAVRHWLIHSVPMVNATGEIVPEWRTVLQGLPSIRWSCVSKGVAIDLLRIVGSYGDKGQHRFDPPLSLRLQKVQTRNGFTVFRLVSFEEVSSESNKSTSAPRRTTGR